MAIGVIFVVPGLTREQYDAASQQFDLAVNLKAAQALGLAIPQSVLLHATEVVQ